MNNMSIYAVTLTKKESIEQFSRFSDVVHVPERNLMLMIIDQAKEKVFIRKCDLSMTLLETIIW